MLMGNWLIQMPQHLFYLFFGSLMGIAAIRTFTLVWNGNVLRQSRKSVVVGALAGSAMALSYSCAWIAAVALYLGIDNGLTNLREMTQVLLAFSSNAMVFGIFPAAIWGGISGGIFHLLFRRWKDRWQPLYLGIMVCGSVILLWHIGLVLLSLLLSDTRNPFAYTVLFYLLFVGLPALLYVGTSLRIVTLISRRIHLENTNDQLVC